MFLESGDIYEMNEDATGNYQEDKKWFIDLYNNTIKNVEVNGQEEI
nr:MAG TPA: hypothetical protein [Caudoviricetes sp.]